MVTLGQIIQAVIMGIVEGLTEFLPVSSSGHLILADYFLGFQNEFTPEFSKMFIVVIQLGAILAIVALYWPKIADTLRNIKPGESGFIFWLKVLVAFLPAAVIGLIFNDLIDQYLFSPLTVALALVVGGFFMIYVENTFNHHIVKDIDRISYKQAFWIGAAQCLALWPGMSRSASTMMGGMMVGLNAKIAAEFSFFLAIPVMFAASGLSIAKDFTIMTGAEWTVLAVGFIISFIVALIVVKAFLGYLKDKGLKSFAVYRIIVGIILLLLIAFRVIDINQTPLG